MRETNDSVEKWEADARQWVRDSTLSLVPLIKRRANLFRAATGMNRRRSTEQAIKHLQAIQKRETPATLLGVSFE
jgi:hypothetical protein